ncbi:MAG: LysR family substrate-binding domain-containing protein [Rhodoglobus sp.]
MPSSFTVAFVLGATPGKWARVFNERLPEVALTLVSSEPEEALRMLHSGAADVALMRLPIDLDSDGDRPLAAIALYTERAVVVVAKDHELATSDHLTVADLSEENIIAGDWRAANELVAAQVGVAIMPQSVARALMRRDVVTRPVTDGPQWQVAVVWREGTVDPHVEEFIGIVRGRTAKSSRGTAASKEAVDAAARISPASKATKKRQQGNRANARAKHPQSSNGRQARPGKRHTKRRDS